jgi:hypothetical protein
MSRLGFACKWIDRPDQVDGIKSTDDCKKYNTGTTTVAWLNRQTTAAAEVKLYQLTLSNLHAAYNLVEYVSKLDPMFRMLYFMFTLFAMPSFMHRWTS